MLNGSLKNWDKEDFVSEMMDQREAMGTKGTSPSERLQIIETAALLYFNSPESLQVALRSHYQEMITRNGMIIRMGL